VKRGLVVLACLLFAACGRKGPVKPPEYTRPAVIADLSAKNEADAILLSWQRPDSYADNSRMTDLGEFRLERAAAGAVDFEIIAVLPVTDRERFRQIKRFRFADRGVVEGESYRYRVVSSTVDGYASAPSNTVEIVREAAQAPTPTPKENREKR
jgi:predicted small lipoprotein YifL